jgi:L-rhamnose isomerase
MKLVGMILKPNRRSMEYSDDNLKGMTAIASNVMTDSEHNVWQVKGEGDARIIVQAEEDDIESIISRKFGSKTTVEAKYQVLASTAEPRDYVMAYFDERVGFGFTYKNEESKLVLVDRVTNKEYQINDDQVLASTIIEASDGLDMDKNLVEAKMSQELGNRLIAFYRRLYASHPDFFAKMETAIRQQIA